MPKHTPEELVEAAKQAPELRKNSDFFRFKLPDRWYWIKIPEGRTLAWAIHDTVRCRAPPGYFLRVHALFVREGLIDDHPD